MTRIVGNDGNFAWDTPAATTVNGAFRSWNANILHETQDVTAFGDAWRTHVAGIRSGTFSAEGVLDRDASNKAPNTDAMTSGAVTLTAATSCTLTGTAIPNSVTLSSDKTGEGTISMDAVFDGAVSETWDET